MEKTNRLLVVGIDGMDPRLTRKYLDEGKLPAIQEFLRRGSARHRLLMYHSI